MARKKSVTLTEVEQRLMEIIWAHGDATVSEVVASLPRGYKAAFNTVQTTIRVLEEKGYLRHEAEGRAFRYFPSVKRQDASESAVRHLLRRFFDDRPAQLAMNLIESERLTPDELARLERMIREARAKE